MTPEKQGRDAAAKFREMHELGKQPLGDLVALIEQTTKHDVTVLDVEDTDQHGLTMRDPKRNVVFIAVARTRHPMRQRSTLAHELSHVLFKDWADAPDGKLSARTPEEQRADAFARHLLLPIEGISGLLGAPASELTEADLSVVVQRFLVSPAMAAIALCNGGYISDFTKSKWMRLTTSQLATRFGWSEQYAMLQDDSDRARVPQRLLSRSIAGYQEGIVSVQTIAVLRDRTVPEIEDELVAADIFPSPPAAFWVATDELPDVGLDLAELDDIFGPDQPSHEGEGNDG